MTDPGPTTRRLLSILDTLDAHAAAELAIQPRAIAPLADTLRDVCDVLAGLEAFQVQRALSGAHVVRLRPALLLMQGGRA